MRAYVSCKQIVPMGRKCLHPKRHMPQQQIIAIQNKIARGDATVGSGVAGLGCKWNSV